MSSAREDVYEEAYDPPRVSWQTDQLYRVEHARRQLAQSRERLRQALAQHERYEEEARQRAVAFQVAQMKRAAWNAPEAVEARRLAAVAEAEEQARALAWVLSRVAEERERIKAITDPVKRDRRLAEMLLRWGNYLVSYGCRGAVKRLYDERLPIIARERGRRAAQQASMQGYFLAAGGRRRWVYVERQKGRTLQSIADAGGLTKERVRQLCAAEERDQAKRWARWMLKRPESWLIDVEGGGPRDIWLNFMPPPDPRLDNMEPVR